MVYLVVGPAWSNPMNKFDGVYSGKRSLVKGSERNCSAQDNVSVTIRGETLTFTNDDLHKFTVGFYPRPDGAFGQAHSRQGGTAIRIRGRITKDIMEADVFGSSCQHHWHLRRVHPGPKTMA